MVSIGRPRRAHRPRRASVHPRPARSSPRRTRARCCSRAQMRQSEALLHHGFAQALGAERQRQWLEEDWGTLLSRDAVGNVNVESVHLGLNSTQAASDLLPLSVWSNLYLRPDTARRMGFVFVACRVDQRLKTRTCWLDCVASRFRFHRLITRAPGEAQGDCAGR
jgi:hypothetical protein